MKKLSFGGVFNHRFSRFNRFYLHLYSNLIQIYQIAGIAKSVYWYNNFSLDTINLFNLLNLWLIRHNKKIICQVRHFSFPWPFRCVTKQADLLSFCYFDFRYETEQNRTENEQKDSSTRSVGQRCRDFRPTRRGLLTN